MKLLSVLSIFIFFSCATQKSQSKVDTKNMTITVEIIINNMPSTDSGSQNYAIVTLDKADETLSDDWKVSEFILKDETGRILQEQTSKELPEEYQGKGKTQMKYNVRNLPSTLPSVVIAEVKMERKDGVIFQTTTAAIHLTIVE